MCRRDGYSTCWKRPRRQGSDQSLESSPTGCPRGLTPLKLFVTVASRGQPFRRRMAKQSQAAKTVAKRTRTAKPAVKKSSARKKQAEKRPASKATRQKAAPSKAAP